jgi:hypothetical protein
MCRLAADSQSAEENHRTISCALAVEDITSSNILYIQKVIEKCLEYFNFYLPLTSGSVVVNAL